ncbi:hypothetical protein [Reinekea sp. G2M2-21]|uniref:hypothetical protein n=1 Tax=Reinekea sp. G2M2-21 TaxID=2788942 RepID=UPI0018AA6538|nr:hypothetical protein [Reinekea sp. G2M2-21]
MKKRVTPRDKKYFASLYASKRRLKNRVLWHERFVASAVAEYLEIYGTKPKRKPRLSSNLEWLLTWKLKTTLCPILMWCDGLENIKVKRIGKYRMAFRSEIWIGPEDGSGITSKGTITGEIEVRHTGKQLKNYAMVIQHENCTYEAKKA